MKTHGQEGPPATSGRVPVHSHSSVRTHTAPSARPHGAALTFEIGGRTLNETAPAEPYAVPDYQSWSSAVTTAARAKSATGIGNSPTPAVVVTRRPPTVSGALAVTGRSAAWTSGTIAGICGQHRPLATARLGVIA